MKAAVLYGKEDVRLEWVPVPELAEGEVLVRVRTALTCGTDVKTYRRGYHAKMIRPPALFGHELAGDIAAVGPGVRDWQVGQRVVAANSAPCDACFYCLRGQQNLCDDLLFNNGAYAEFLRIPARLVEKNLYVIPDSIAYADAALIEPFACVLRGIEETGVRAGDTVAVLGLGPIGSMFVRLCAVLGMRVIAIGRRPEQLERARHLGASECVDLSSGVDPLAVIRALTGERGADAVVEAVGKPEMWQLAITLVRKGGTVNFFGGCPSGTEVALDTERLHYSEITCKASFHHTPRHIREALDHVVAGHIRAVDFVQASEPLEELPRVLRELAERNAPLKTAILP